MKPYRITVVRYAVESVQGHHLDVFSKRTKAIAKAIELATEYPGGIFRVVKKVNFKRTVIFTFDIQMTADFSDIQDAYRGAIAAFEKKLAKTKYWRKLDEPNN